MKCYTKPYNLCPQGVINSKCVVYTGANLTSISVTTNDRLDVILEKINESIGDFDFSLFIEDTATLNLSGAGTFADPLLGDVNISSFPNNAITTFVDGVWSANTIVAGVVYGGIVTWLQDYDFHVSAARYYINGNLYESPAADFTLSPPDGTFNRLDTFIVDIGGTASVLEGTPSATPSQAPLDPATQLQLSLTLVEVGTTEPTLGTECIYKENIEWTAVTSNLSQLNPDSTTNPCFGIKTIEGTSVATNTNIVFTRSSAFTPASIYTQLTFFIRNKGSWANTRYLEFQWRLAGTPIGATVKMFPGSFGFVASNTTTCQVISLPMSNFGLGTLTSVDELKIRAFAGTGGLPGFYLDDICLQDVEIVSIPTSPDEKVKVSINDTVAGYLNGKLVAGTGITLTELNNGGNETFSIATIPGAGGEILSADNGLTENVPNNVQLGGPLITNTSIDLSTFSLNFTDTAGSGYVQLLPNSFSGVGTMLTMVSTDAAGPTNTAVTVSGNEITLQGNTPVTSETYYLTVASGAATLNYTDTVTPYRISVGNAIGGTGIELFGLPNNATQDRLVGLTSTTSIAGYITIGSGLSLASGVLSSTGSLTADNGLTENVANNVQLGGTLIQNTTIDGNFTTLFHNSITGLFTLNVKNDDSGGSAISGDGGNTGVYGQSVNGTGVQGVSTNGVGVYAAGTNSGIGLFATSASSSIAAFAQATDGVGLVAANIPASASTIEKVVEIRRNTSGTAGNGIGGSLGFYLQTTTTPSQLSNEIISKWTDATNATRTSQFIITGINNAVTADLFTLSGNGATRLNNYGISTFTGTAATYAAFDSSGNIIEVSGIGSGPVITADNGLTKNSATNVQLGGALINATTTIDAGTNLFIGTSTFTDGGVNSAFTFNNTLNTASLTVGLRGSSTGTNPSSAGVVGTHTGIGIGVLGNSATGAGILGISSSGIAGDFRSTSGKAISGNSGSGVAGYFQINPASTNTIANVAQLVRFSSGSAGNGIGGSLQFLNESSDTAAYESGNISSTWTDITVGTRTGNLQFWTTNSAVSALKMTIAGDGTTTLHGTPYTGLGAGFLAVSNTGVLSWSSGTGAGGATTALNNLASVAVNTSLISDTDNTDDLGSSSISWKDTYTRTVKFDGSTSGTATIQAPAVAGTPTLTLPTITGTIVQYVEGTTASSATPTPTGDARENYYDVTALAVNATFGAPTGTPANHNGLLIRVKDNGSARTLAFNAIYRAGTDIVLPTSTVLGKVMYLQFIYSSQDSTWDLVGFTDNI